MSVTCAAATASLQAQSRELVFVGSSVAGGADPYYVVDPDAGELVFEGRAPQADNLTDAVWDARRRELITTAALGRVLCRVSGLGEPEPTWDVIARRPQALYGVGWDPARRRAYSLEGDHSNERVFLAFDADPASPSHGAVVGRCEQLAGASFERWTLAPSGRFAVLPTMLMEGGLVRWIDTDPASPTCMRVLGEVAVPLAAGFSFCGAAALSPDEQFAFFTFAGTSLSVVARLHLPTRRWIDFDTSRDQVQHRALPHPAPSALAMSTKGDFLVVAGQSESGWLARLDLDRAAPSEIAISELAAGQGVLDKAAAAALSPDDRRIAVASLRPSKLVVVDARTGEVLTTVELPGGRNLGVVAWCGTGR